MLHKIVPGDPIALTPQKRHGRTYYMGTVVLSTARVRYDLDSGLYVLGEVLHEAVEADEPTHKVRGMMHKYQKSMGEITAAGAYVVNYTLWVSKEVQ